MTSIQKISQGILSQYTTVQEWLSLLHNLGRASATIDAYSRALVHYLTYCKTAKITPEIVTFEQISLYISNLLPCQKHAIANSTLHQRLTAIRLWYDHLVFIGQCEKNPIPRGQHLSFRSSTIHDSFVRGLVPRLIKLPEIPNSEQWKSLLQIVAESSIRNRLMLALAYYGALRRSELVALTIQDLDIAHRLIRLRAETTKSRKERIVCYSPEVSPILLSHLQQLRHDGWKEGALFRSVSDRNRGDALSKWSWSKIVALWAKKSGISSFSTHTLRHLRLTHLAQAGWKLHELSAYAGHSDPKTTQIYLHLSGAEITIKMAQSIANNDNQVSSYLFPNEIKGS